MGSGGLCGDQFFMRFLRLSSSSKFNYLKLLTIIDALKLWGLRWSGLRLTIRCNNVAAGTVKHWTVSELFSELAFAPSFLSCGSLRIRSSRCSHSRCYELLCRPSLLLRLVRLCWATSTFRSRAPRQFTSFFRSS